VFGCINLGRWIVKDLQNGILPYMKRFERMKLEIANNLCKWVENYQNTLFYEG